MERIRLEEVPVVEGGPEGTEERDLGEGARGAAGGGDAPRETPAGASEPRESPHRPGASADARSAALDHECLEWCPICRSADVVRASLPPEVREQWHDAQREALSALRALIDHYLQRLEREPAVSRVEDIPID